MKQTFKFLTLSRVFNDCRDTVGRLSTLILLLVGLFGFTTNAWAETYTKTTWACLNGSFYTSTWEDIGMTSKGTDYYEGTAYLTAGREVSFKAKTGGVGDDKKEWGPSWLGFNDCVFSSSMISKRGIWSGGGNMKLEVFDAASGWVKVDYKFWGNNNGDTQLDISQSEYKDFGLKHKWPNYNDWGWKGLDIDNGDGTFSVDENFREADYGFCWHLNSDGANYNRACIDANDVIKVGNPGENDKCRFTLSPKNGTVTVTRYDKVTYNANGATAGSAPSAQEQLHGQSLNLAAKPDALAKTGYIFNGWNTQEDGQGTHYAASSSYTMNGDVTLYAEWKKQTYVVTFGGHNNNEHGSLEAKVNSIDITSPANVDASATVNFTAKPAIGYEVEGWYDNSGCSTGKITSAETSTTYDLTINEAKTVYVKFKAQTYSITYKDQGGATFSGSHASGHPTQHTYDQSTALKSATKNGYNFLGWHKNSDCSDQAITQIGGTEYTANITLYAKWEEILSTITINTPNAAQGTLNVTGEKSLGVTTSQSITATPKPGYYFKQWNVTGAATVTSTTSASTTLKANGTGAVGTVSAVFELRWVLRGCRNTTNDPLDGMPGWSTTTDYFEFEANATQGTKTVTLYPNYEYRFVVYDKKTSKQQGWEYSGTLNANEWQKLYQANGAPVKMNTAGYGEYIFSLKEESDQPVVMITNPTSHLIMMNTKTYSDGNVSGDTGGTLTAKTTEGGQDFDISDGKYVRNGGAVVFTATPKTGYTFAGFYSDANCTGTQITEGVVDNKYTATISANKAVYAKFTENMTKVIINWDGFGKVQVKNGANWVDATKGVTFVQAGVYTHPDVKAVLDNDKSGSHYFAKWTWNANADFEAENWDEDHSETKVIGFGTGRQDGQVLTANFLELDKIYFNNNAEGVYHWPTGNSIHVFFDVAWNADKGVYPAGCKHYTMTQIGTTNIWWTYIPRSVYKGIWHTLAFADADMSMNEYFHQNHAAYRFDFDSYYNMYVPEEDGENKNETAYYSEGYWMRYEGYQSGNETGYELHKKSDGALLGKFIATGPNEGRVDCRLDQTGDAIGFYVSTTQGGIGFGSSEKFTNTSTSHELSHYRADYKFNVKVDAEGDYSFTLKFGEGKKMILEIGYPVGEGDYRVAWTDGSSKKHYSDVVKSNEASEAHTLSMYLKPNEGNLKLQKCTDITDGVPQWSEGTAINWTDFTKGQGVYQFDITITADNAALTNVDLYTGNYYIKTDGVKGGWGNYKENIMDENTSTFSKTDPTTYDRYYCQWISNEGKKYNVKCVIANDYCNALSDTLREDNYTEMSGTEPLLPQPANVRFSYNTYTNTLSRAYISGSSEDADRFLMLIGNDKMFGTDEQPLVNNELKFIDKNNWVYQADIKAQPGCAVKLTAAYNGKVQYFIGAEGDEAGSRDTIIKGSSTDKTKYTMRVVYDFKTNLLIAGWMPSDTIKSNIALGGDMLITRTHQDSAQQIIFGENVSISDIHHVYGVLTIKKDTMLGKNSVKYTTAATNTDYDRTMYWISFPFKVKISEIFGVDGYGTKWIMQKYRGDLRAQKGWFKEDTPTFWEYMDIKDSLNAYEGYLFLLDANYFNKESADVWKNSATEANFYFPSASGNIGIINKSSFTQEVPENKCGIDREFEVDGVGTVNHKNTDSYWNVIGVPAFQNKSMVLGTETETDMKAIYKWNSENNTYTPQALADEFRFQTMHAYMVQFGGDITWLDVSVVNNTKAPYRYAYADTKNYFIKLFFGNGEAEDHAYINLADEASTDFVLNEDMMKLDNAGFPNIYSFAGNYNVAYNETKMVNQIVTLGVSAPKNGTYTFSMPKEFSGTAQLFDMEEGTITDLNVSNYSVNLNKGTYNNRFQLLLEVEAKVPTSLVESESGEWKDGKTLKLLRNGNIYLINAGRVYNATGVEIR